MRIRWFLALLVTAWMSEFGSGQETKPKSDPFAELPDTKMITVEYYLPPTYISRETNWRDTRPDPSRKTAQEVLESYGVHFPEGAKAEFDGVTGFLTVTQTINNIEKIDEIIISIRGGYPKHLFIELKIIALGETDAERVAELARQQFNHNESFQAALELVKEEKGKIVASTHVMPRSGQKGRSESGIEVAELTALNWNTETGNLVPSIGKRNAGLVFEVDPVIGNDQIEIDLNYLIEYHYRPPEVDVIEVTFPGGKEQEIKVHTFFADRFVSQVTMTNGSTLLVGRIRCDGVDVTKSKPEERLAFITASVLSAVDEPNSWRRVIDDGSPKSEGEPKK